MAVSAFIFNRYSSCDVDIYGGQETAFRMFVVAAHPVDAAAGRRASRPVPACIVRSARLDRPQPQLRFGLRLFCWTIPFGLRVCSGLARAKDQSAERTPPGAHGNQQCRVPVDRMTRHGDMTRPRNRMLPETSSRIRNRNGWSALNTGGGSDMETAVRVICTAVAAAASVPFSFTST